MLLGAGRARMDSPVDHAVGVILHKKAGDAVRSGEPLVHIARERRIPAPGGGGADPGCLHHRRRASGPAQPLLIERIAACAGPSFAALDRER